MPQSEEPDVVRLTSSDALDPTFGSGGVAVALVPSGNGQFNGLSARTDGSVIAAGVTSGETLLRGRTSASLPCPVPATLWEWRGR